MKKTIIFIIFTVMLIGLIPQSQVTSKEVINVNNNVTFQNEPLENSSLPYLTVDQPEIDLGQELTIRFGMRNASTFYSGYPYSLILINGNFPNITYTNITTMESRYLKNGTTLNTIDDLTISSVTGSQIYLPANQYTIIFLVNSTNRGLMNATAFFEVVAKSGANLIIDFVDDSSKSFELNSVDLKINETKKIFAKLTNIGSNPALNISVTRVGPLNEPLGLFNSSIEQSFEFLGVLEAINVSFSVKPPYFGFGRINIDIEYSQASGGIQVLADWFDVIVLPDIEAHIITPQDRFPFLLENPDGIEIQARTRYLETSAIEPLILSVILRSDEIDFTPPKQSFSTDRDATYNFDGTAKKSGDTQIYLIIEFSEEEGGRIDQSIQETFDSISIKINSEGEFETDYSLIDYITIIAIILYVLLIIIILILYLRKGLRRRFFSRILGINFFPELKFNSNQIIIDGSNVAWENVSSDGKPQIQNIILAMDILKQYGFDDITIVADAALRYQIEKKADLDNLTEKGLVKVLPAKVEGDGFILRLSARSGSLILTNDLFKEFREEYPWIDQRRVPYSILKDAFFLHPLFVNKDFSKLSAD